MVQKQLNMVEPVVMPRPWCVSGAIQSVSVVR